MAWNEPGGKKPWPPNNDSPPDLDEVIQDLQKKFGGLFGSGGSSGFSLIFFLVAALVIWALLGFYILDASERAVLLRFGKYHETVGPGLHWRMPLVDTKVVVNVEELREYTLPNNAGLMLTQDENIVDTSLSVQYKVREVNDYVLKVKEPDGLLQRALEAALRQVAGQSTFDQLLTTDRKEIEINTQEKLQALLDRYETGILATKVNLDKIEPPLQVKEAFDDVIKAREDEKAVINQAEAYQNQVVPVAQGQAKRILAEAEAYKEAVVARSTGEAERFNQLLTEYKKAPGVTRERLYLETVESVLGSTTKILVDVDGSSLMYLPLDKLFGNKISGQPAMENIQQQLPASRDQAANLANEIRSRIDERSRDRARLRQRGGN